VTSFGVGYAVLAVNVVLDGVAFAYALRETKRGARARRRSIVQYIRRTTEPATATAMATATAAGETAVTAAGETAAMGAGATSAATVRPASALSPPRHSKTSSG
jgi:hypothetical protein